MDHLNEIVTEQEPARLTNLGNMGALNTPLPRDFDEVIRSSRMQIRLRYQKLLPKRSENLHLAQCGVVVSKVHRRG